MKKPTKGIAVDGSTRGNPGPSEYRAVDLETGAILFSQKIGVATNNIAEFIALGHAILYCLQNDIRTTIYSDSQTALSWLKNKRVNSKLPLSEKTNKALDYLERIMSKLFAYDVVFDGVDLMIGDLKIEKWYTSEFGEIPADYNLK